MIQSKAFLIVALFVEAASAAESTPSGVLASRNDLSISFFYISNFTVSLRAATGDECTVLTVTVLTVTKIL
jgi:hypothetical protein